ncbi:MAG: DUF1385 domain-containing protein [Monoglobales bacterium]
MKKDKNKPFKTSIGGQAVLEGVMMKGPDKMAVAVRKSNGEIIIDKKEVSSVTKKVKILKLPIIRGVVSFVESMVLGIKTLMYSAELYDMGEDDPTYKPSKFDAWLEKHVSKDAVVYFSLILALFLSVGLFVLLPAFITKYTTGFIENSVLKSLIEGVIRMVIFVLYIYLSSLAKDIKRVFEYHGAEHKTIYCYEKGEELTVENVKKQSRLHPRCGTSFLIEVMILSIIAFSVISWDNLLVRIALKLLLLPVIAGVAYEFIKFSGRSENKCVAILTKPGLWLQKITTEEPDEQQIEVAITAMKEVIPENIEDAKW